MAKIAPFVFWQLLDNNADVLAGGKVYTYDAGTTTPKQTFTDANENTSNANPVILDGDGRANVWLDSGAYKFVLKDSADNTIATVDGITGGTTDVYGAEVVELTSNTPVIAAYQNAILDCIGTLTLSLLDIATAEEGFLFAVKNSGSGLITIDPDGSETIDGSTTKIIQPGGSVNVACTGSGWLTFNENYGTTNVNDMVYARKHSFADAGELTIASGAITVIGVNHTVDTQGDASSDDLDTINGEVDGGVLVIRPNNDGRTVIIKHDSGNILTGDGNDITLDDEEKTVLLKYDNALSKWIVLSSTTYAITSGRYLSMQVFTSSGTWTKPTGVNAVKVTVIGGGGGGGFQEAGGGGSGGASIKRIDVTGTASETVTIGSGGAGDTNTVGRGGDGGASSFGTYCSATGGTGGHSDSAGSLTRKGGGGGVGSGGDVNIAGGPGENGDNDLNLGGKGGSNLYGGGGEGGGASTVGSAGQNGGGGGGGGSSSAGGAGGTGIVVVEEYS